MAGAAGGTSPSQSSKAQCCTLINGQPAGWVSSSYNAAITTIPTVRKREQVEMAVGASAVASGGSGPSQVTCIPPAKTPKLEPTAAGVRGDAHSPDPIQQLLETCIRQAKEVKACTGKKWFPPLRLRHAWNFAKEQSLRSQIHRASDIKDFRFTNHLRGTRVFGIDETLQEEANALGLLRDISGRDRWRDGDGVDGLLINLYESQSHEAEREASTATTQHVHAPVPAE